MDARALDLAVGGEGTVVILNAEGVAAKWDGKRGWSPIAGAKGVRVAVDAKGLPWLVTAEGKILRHTGRAWQDLPGEAREIAIGPEGTAMIATPDNELKIWRQVARRWDPVTEKPAVAALAVGPRGKPWVVSPEGDVYATDMFQAKEKEQKEKAPTADPAEPAAPAVPPETVTSTEPIVWQRVAGTAQDVGIGAKGHVFVVDAVGNLLRWSTRQRRFSPFGGVLAKVAVDEAGNPWGVDAAGAVHRFDGSRWRTLSRKARDIAIGADGSVFVTDRDDGRLFQYTASDNRFRPRAGAGTRVAVDPDGVPWVVDDQDAVRRCATAGCVPMGASGRDIAIGPDGTVVVAGTVSRFQPETGTWERLPEGANAIAVAVGPKGRPWYVDTANAIFASEFFTTDDDRQPQEAVAAGTTTTPAAPAAAVPTITFRKNIPLEIKRDGTRVGAAADGKVFAVDVLPGGGEGFYVTTNGGRTFQLHTEVPGDDPDDFVRSVALTADGRLWYSLTFGRIIEEKSPKGGTRDAPGVPPGDGSIPPVVAVGSDGTVFALGADRQLYRYDSSARKFKKAGISGTFTWVAVDGNGLPWLADATGRLLRYEDGKLVDPGKHRQTTDLFAFGPTGALFVVDKTDGRTIRRWNATNRDFDEVKTGVSSVTWQSIAVDDQGEPWLAGANQIYGPK
jgi:streptogramin lyase